MRRQNSRRQSASAYGMLMVARKSGGRRCLVACSNAKATPSSLPSLNARLWAIGMIPARLTRPTVGFRPTRPQVFDGDPIEPSVSVPMPTAAKLAAMAPPVPELDPDGLRSSA